MPRSLPLILALSLAAAGCDSPEQPAMALAIDQAEDEVSEVTLLPMAQKPVKPRVRPMADGATLETLRDIGLSRPVAVIHDAAADVYLISNAGRDGDPGFITSVLPDGSVDAVRWIDGELTSPAGMALAQTRLFVADGEHLHVFDRETGVSRGAIHIPEAVALSDVAAGARGAVYVTDAGSDGAHAAPGAVYRVSRRGTVTVIAKSSVLGRPTGLVTVKGTAWIAAAEPETFYGVDRRGRLTRGAALPFEGRYAGLTQADGRIFFSSPEARTVYAGPIEGPFEAVVFDVASPGDVGWDAGRERLLVPLSDDDALEVHTLTGEPNPS